MEIVIVTGLSGAGKSKAVDALEDIGFFCIDNIPPLLIPKFAEMAAQSPKMKKVAIVIDVRGGDLFNDIYECINELKQTQVDFKILYLDAEDRVLEKRYKESRRRHPLATQQNVGITEAVQQERELLKPLYDMSDYMIDTSYLSVAQLRDRVITIFSEASDNAFQVIVQSFGYKFGLPSDSDLVLDVRCLDNPFYVDELKELTGLDQPIVDWLREKENTGKLLDSYTDFLRTSIPMYIKEGKSELVITVGCTGGKHRSVYIAERINEFVRSIGLRSEIIHRDIYKHI